MATYRTYQDALPQVLDARRQSGVRRRRSALDSAQRLHETAAHVTALDGVSEAALIVDRHGIVAYTNQAFDALTGHPDNRMVGQGIERLLAGPMPMEVRAVMSALRRAGVCHISVSARDAKGRTLPLDLRITPSSDARGVQRHFCIIAQTKSLDRIRSPLAPLTRVAAEIAHDLNNQIAVVLNYSFVLARHLPEGSPLRSHVTEMQTAAWRASQVAQELLDLGGERIADTEALDVNVVVTALAPLVMHALGEAGALQVQLAEHAPRIRARLPQIEWLLIELALKARAHVQGGGQFTLSVHDEPGTAGAPRMARLTLRASPVSERADKPARRPTRPTPVPGAPILPGVELALAHAAGELHSAIDADDVLVYSVLFPAL